jgi:hypothetical protein
MIGGIGTTSHCCACAGVCWHVGGPYLCAMHDPRNQPSSGIQPNTVAKLPRQSHQDRPCPATCMGILGFLTPTLIPCGLAKGHAGSHRYSIEWTGESPPSVVLAAGEDGAL